MTIENKDFRRHVGMYREWQAMEINEVIREVDSMAWYAGYLLMLPQQEKFDRLMVEMDQSKAAKIEQWYPLQIARLKEVASRNNTDLAEAERDLCNRAMGAKAVIQVIEDCGFDNFYAGFSCAYGDVHNGCGCEDDIQLAGSES